MSHPLYEYKCIPGHVEVCQGGKNKSQFRCKCLGSKEKVTTKCSRGGGLISLKVFIGFVVLFEAVWIN